MAYGDGAVRQRHSRRCPRTPDGREWAPHRCRGRWEFILDAGRDRESGKRIQIRKSGFVSQQEARAALREAQERLQVADPKAGRMTVGEWLDRWLESRHEIRPSSRARHESIIRLHLRPLIGDIPLADLRPEDVDKVLVTLAAPGYVPLPSRTARRWRGKEGLSTASVNRVWDTLRAALAVAADPRRRLIPFNVAAACSPPREVNKVSVVWTAAQAVAFLKYPDARRDRLYAAWDLALKTGARRGELAGVRMDHIDLDSGIWRLVESRVQTGGVTSVEAPKTLRGERIVFLDPSTIAILREHLRRRDSERLEAGPAWVESGYLFTAPDGTPISPGALTRAWNHAVLVSGAPKIRLHDARHVSASLGLATGVADRVMSDRLGHSKVTMTHRYQHVDENAHRDAARRIAAALGDELEIGAPR